MSSVIDQNNFDKVLPESQDMNKAASTSFNVVNITDINSELL